MTAVDDSVEAKPWHLSGNNAPVFKELTISDLEVVGALPPELNGRYFRNGANPQTGMSHHWFLGDGMVHGVELRNGKANWYRNRYVRTPMYANPDKDRMELYLDPETFTFNYEVGVANTHVIGHAGRILALEEGSFPYELTREIETIGPHTFGNKLTTAMTAHPKICAETGELLFFGYSSLEPWLTYHRATAAGELVQSTPITVNGPTMMHDFVVSRQHSVFMDLPMIFDMDLAMSGSMPIRWSDDYPARFGVMPRQGGDGDVQWFDIDPCYVFHTLNAHDEGDEVVVHGCRIRELWRDNADIGGSRDPGDAPMMWQWRLNRATGKVREQQLDERGSDFPRVPDSRVGLTSRYGYTLALGETATSGAVFKYDMASGATRTEHVFPAGHFAGEPSFVPAAGATNEDDGYLLTYVHKGDTNTSYLAVLDAGNMAADPVAEVHLGARVPSGFHGSWIAD